MSATMISNAAADAAAYKTTHVLLDNAATTVAGGTAEIGFTGEYMLSIEGSFATAATVNVYGKRVTESAFNLLADLSTGTAVPAQYTSKGGASFSLNKGDKIYAQLSGITGTPAISAKLTYVGN